MTTGDLHEPAAAGTPAPGLELLPQLSPQGQANDGQRARAAAARAPTTGQADDPRRIVQCRELPILLLVPLTPSCARRRTGSPVRWLPEPPPRELSALAPAVLVKVVRVIMQDTSTRFHDPCAAAFAHRQKLFPLHTSSVFSFSPSPIHHHQSHSPLNNQSGRLFACLPFCPGSLGIPRRCWGHDTRPQHCAVAAPPIDRECTHPHFIKISADKVLTARGQGFCAGPSSPAMGLLV